MTAPDLSGGTPLSSDTALSSDSVLSGDTAPSEQIPRLRWVIGQLRRHCPWTRELNHAALVEYLVEEAYEVVEEVEAGESGEPLRKELGDLFFQVALHAQLAQERGDFDLDGVAEAINSKLIRRNPHVFTSDGRLDVDAEATVDQIEQAWHRIKADEKAAARAAADGEQAPSSAVGLRDVADSLPAHLPALARAAKLIDRLGREGTQILPEPGPGTAGSPRSAVTSLADPADEAALGELLFSVVQYARANGQDPERALRNYVKKLAQ